MTIEDLESNVEFDSHVAEMGDSWILSDYQTSSKLNFKGVEVLHFLFQGILLLFPT